MDEADNIYAKAKDLIDKYHKTYSVDSETSPAVFGEEEILLNRDELLRSLLRLVKINTNVLDEIETEWIEKDGLRYDELKDELWSSLQNIINGNQPVEIFRSLILMLQIRKSKGESLRRIEKLCFDLLLNIWPTIDDKNCPLRKLNVMESEKEVAILKQQNEFLTVEVEDLKKKQLDAKKREVE